MSFDPDEYSDLLRDAELKLKAMQMAFRDIGILIAEFPKSENDCVIMRIAKIVDKHDPPQNGSASAVTCAAERVDGKPECNGTLVHCFTCPKCDR